MAENSNEPNPNHVVSGEESLLLAQDLDALFLEVVVALFKEPYRWWQDGQPGHENWIGPAFLAFRATLYRTYNTVPIEVIEESIERLWHPFVNWFHLILGCGLREHMLAHPSVRRVHARVDALKKAGHLPHLPPQGLAKRVAGEARRKGGRVASDLTDDDLYAELFLLAAPNGLTLDSNGRWTLNVQELYDRVRQRRQAREFICDTLDDTEDDGAHDPHDIASYAEMVRALRDALDDFRGLGSAEAGAVDRRLNAGSRREVAARHEVSVEQLRGAEKRLESLLARIA